MVLVSCKLDFRSADCCVYFLFNCERKKASDRLVIMYKILFEGKKAVIFNLDDAVITGLNEIKIQVFQKVMNDVFLGYIDPTSYCIPGYSFRTIWESILYANEIEKGKFKIKDLIEKTTNAYIETINNEGIIIDTTDGFWQLFGELKEDHGFKTALVSNYPKPVVDKLTEKIELEGIFDVVVCNENTKEELHRIYKKVLKKLKMNPKKVVSFEGSIPGVRAANKAKVDVFVIWDLKTRKSFFGDKVKEFSLDFTAYPGNIDKTYEEYLAESVKGAIEDKKQRQSL